MQSNSEQSMHKSRFRGVYKCGRRWKAQLQSQGVQFYLGTFDTEEEAAKAYDAKAREEKGEKSQTNFDESGVETTVCQYRAAMNPLVHGNADFSAGGPPLPPPPPPSLQMPLSFGAVFTQGNGGTVSPSNQQHQPQKRSRLDLGSAPVSAPTLPMGSYNGEATAEQVRVMWDKTWQVSQRLVLANAAREKLVELQKNAPDPEKASLLKSLCDEITLLELVKSQLEEAIGRALTQSQTALTVLHQHSLQQQQQQRLTPDQQMMPKELTATSSSGTSDTLEARFGRGPTATTTSSSSPSLTSANIFGAPLYLPSQGSSTAETSDRPFLQSYGSSVEPSSNRQPRSLQGFSIAAVLPQLPLEHPIQSQLLWSPYAMGDNKKGSISLTPPDKSNSTTSNNGHRSDELISSARGQANSPTSRKSMESSARELHQPACDSRESPSRLNDIEPSV